MIELTRLNGCPLVLNSDLLKYAESSPDTMLTLVNGEKIMVLESCEVVTQRVLEYRTRLLAEALKIDMAPAILSVAHMAEGLRSAAASVGGNSSASVADDPSATVDHTRRDAS